MLLRFPGALLQQRELVWRLTIRQILERYRGSVFGWGWMFCQPLMMLAVYTFFFSQVFQARWPTPQSSTPHLAVILYVGLIVFGLISESLAEAPLLIIQNPHYVKKVVFPLETLAAIGLGVSLFRACCSVAILMLVQLLLWRSVAPTLLWLPVVWLPLILGALGLGWLLSMLGVFLRDTTHFVGVILQMLLFVSPVFYPLAALPAHWRPLLALNPLAVVIEETRAVLLLGHHPSPLYVMLGTLLSLLFCEISFRIFCRAKPAFADYV